MRRGHLALRRGLEALAPGVFLAGRRSAVAVNTDTGRSRSSTGLIVALGAVLLAGGCAVMSESQCVNADWRAVGEQDGRAGRPQARLSDYYRVCAQYGITPDADAYEAGREIGLSFFCSSDNGYRQGRVGIWYQGVCPEVLEPDFLFGYEVGVSVGRAAENVKRIENRIEGEEDAIKDLKREIEELESPGGSGGTKEKDSDDTKTEAGVKDKYRELGRLEGVLEQLRDEKIQAVVEYRLNVDEARRRGFFEIYAY